jgi:hypothetical protein
LEPKDWVAYICAGAGLVAALVAMLPSRLRAASAVTALVLFVSAGIVGLVGQHKPGTPSPTTANASPATAPSASDPVSRRTVMVDALQTGDCIIGGDLRLDNADVEMPSSAQILSCDEPHDGEILLTSDPWAEDAGFPGSEVVTTLSNGRCEDAFRSYIGMAYENSVLEYMAATPTGDTWKSGDRHILCIAYDPQGKLTGSVRRAAR